MKRLLLLALPLLLSGGIAAEVATAKGVGQMAAAGGVTVHGSPYRYAAMSPNAPQTRTVIVRTDRDDGRISRWWYLPGTYVVPAVAYDLSGGGLSADGSTLVLSRFSNTYPPPTSRFAILNTRLRLRHPWDPPEHRADRAVSRLALRGDFSFDAISPDGSTLYLIHRLPKYTGPDYIANYEVRAFDLERGKLLPRRIVDPNEPNERMEGIPITRASSPDGRWAYTLYDGNGGEPFVHALDTVEARAVCVDLPQLEGHRNIFMLKLKTDRDGRELSVLSGPAPSRDTQPVPRALGADRPVRRLLTLDTRSFQVTAPSDTASESGGIPWLPIGISLLTLVGAIAWIAGRGRGASSEKGLGSA